METSGTEGMQQPRVGIDPRGRQLLEPAGERFATSLGQHRLGFVGGQPRDIVPVGGLERERDRVLGLPGLAQHCRGASQRGLPERIREHLGRAAFQELAQQRMQLVDAPPFVRYLAHEIVVQREIDQQARGVGIAGDRLGGCRGHARQTGDAQEELAGTGLEAVEDLAGEKVEQGLRRVRVGKIGHLSRALGVLEHQHEPGGPALRALLEPGGGLRGERLAAQLGDRHQFVAPDAQVVSGHADQGAGGPQACQGGGRLLAARHDDAASARNLVKARRERGVECAVLRDRVQAIEDQCDRWRGKCEQLPKEAPGEGCNVVRRMRREGRQVAVGDRIELARPVAKVVEEGRRVGVVRIELVPDARPPARLEVAGRKRGLACAGRSGDPGDRPPRFAVEPREQCGAREGRPDPGSGRLGECDPALTRLDHRGSSRVHLLTVAATRGCFRGRGAPATHDVSDVLAIGDAGLRGRGGGSVASPPGGPAAPDAPTGARTCA